jgi:putative ABC transport system substrate-binding protein
LGWIEGKNITFQRRFAENNADRLIDLAAELVGLKVDVILAGGTLAPLAAKRVTSTIPIVMLSAGDPLGSGLVASLARPGGNVTGLSVMSTELGAKRLGLLRTLNPRVSRAAVVWNSANPYSVLVFKQTADAANTLGIEVQPLGVQASAELDNALDSLPGRQVDGLVVVDDPLTLARRAKIAQVAADSRLPAIYGLREFTDAGGLMSYGADLADLFRRSVGYVDKIFKGAKPADLPVEQPTKFELVINLKAANALGLTVPPTLVAGADELID